MISNNYININNKQLTPNLDSRENQSNKNRENIPDQQKKEFNSILNAYGRLNMEDKVKKPDPTEARLLNQTSKNGFITRNPISNSNFNDKENDIRLRNSITNLEHYKNVLTNQRLNSRVNTSRRENDFERHKAPRGEVKNV